MNLKKKFKQALTGILTAVTMCGSLSAVAINATTQVQAESYSVSESNLYSAIAGLTGVNLSDKSLWGDGSSTFLISPLYGTTVGSDVIHVTNDDYSSYAGQEFDCVRFSLATVGHALKEAGANPTGAITQIGYNFNGNGAFTRSTNPADAQPGDILVYGEGASASHMSVCLGYKDGTMYTISGSYSGHGPIIKAFSTTAGSGGNSCSFSAVYRLPHEKQVSLSVKKSSNCTNLTNGNNLYSNLTATFGVYSDSGCTNQLGTITTDANGNGSAAYTVSASLNTLYVKELYAPTNYDINSEVKTVDVSSGSGSVEVSDTPFNDPLAITITKNNAEGKSTTTSLAGAKFEVKYYDTLSANSNSDLDNMQPTRTWTFKTTELSANGKTAYRFNTGLEECYAGGDELYRANSGAIIYPLGTYTIKEIDSPTGYTVNGGYATKNGEVFSAEETLFVKFTKNADKYKITYGNNLSDPELVKQEQPIRGGFSITKVDSVTGRRVQGDAQFANAQFDLYYVDSTIEPNKGITVMVDGKEYKPGEKITTITLDENGLYSSADDYLEFGKYKLVEVKTPVGMAKCEDQEFTISNDKEIIGLTAKETVYDGDISIHKTYSQNDSSFASHEEGAVFDIVASKYVKQYAVDPDNITREDVINAYNHRADWTGTDKDGNAITGYTNMEYDQITTNSKGKATSKKLAYGEYYMVQESGKKNYQVIKNPITFTISSEHQETLEFEATNKPKKYTLKMLKRDAETGELVTLNSAVFKVKKLTDADGKDVSAVTDKTLGLENGYVTQVVGDGSDKTVYSTFKTVSTNAATEELEAGMFYPANSSDGLDSQSGSVAVPLELEAGTYRLEEVVTPDSFATGKSFEFTIDDDSITRVNEYDQNVIEVTMKDSQILGNFSVVKSLDSYEDADTILVEHDLTQFGFTLYAGEDIINPDDGSVIVSAGEEAVMLENGAYKTIGEKFADADGKLSFSNLPMGKYTLVESTQPEGTVTNVHKYSVTVEQTKFDRKVADADVTLKDFQVAIDDEVVTNSETAIDYAIENYTTKTEITKTDISGGDELPGAHLTVTDSDGNTIDEWDSTEESHKIEGLKANGTYTLHEDLAPLGYYYSSDVEFTVKNSKVVQKVEMIDNPIVYEIKKVDEDGNTVEGVKLTLTDITDPANPSEIELPNEGITTKEPFKLDKVLQIEHTYKLVETELVGGVYKATDIQFTVPRTGSSEPYTITMVDDLTGVNVLKTDECGNAVEGAKLKLVELEQVESPDDAQYTLGGKMFKEGETVYEFTSTDEAIDVSRYVKGGYTYALIETEAPFGYDQPTVKDADGNDVPVATLFTVTGTDEEAQVVTYINNRKHFYVSAVKVDANDEKTLLKGAEITVFNKSDDTVAKTVFGEDSIGITDGKGNIVFELPYSKDGYYVMETGAPEGYDLNPNKFDVELTEDYDFAKTNPIVIKVADSLLPAEESESGVAGINPIYPIVGIGTGIGIAAVAYFISKKKKSEEDTSDTHDDSKKESD